VTLGRRALLQRLAAALALLGVTDVSLAGAAPGYQRALALPANRRFALLVGIDQYPEAVWQGGRSSGHGFPLQGCGTDVRLQRQLLIHRFGFAPQDVVTLINGEATREAIVSAIDHHLVDQAQPGDTVVFHFSGLGGQVKLSDRPDRALPTLVAVDSHLPRDGAPEIQDLFEGLIAARLRQLRTAQITTVIDASSAEPRSSLQGNLRVRSRPCVPTGDLPQDLGTVEMAPGSLDNPPWPGLVLRASRRDRVALESDWAGFSAGLFTYTLTQQLWGTVPGQDRETILQQVNHILSRWVAQGSPAEVTGQLPPAYRNRVYGTSRDRRPPAIGNLLSLSGDGKRAKIWLGGLVPTLLAYTGAGTRLRPVVAPGTASPPSGDIVLSSRDGLVASAPLQAQNALKAGIPLVEAVRILPRGISLRVALDGELERIERVDATSALAGIPYVATAQAGEQMADCLFGRVRPDLTPTLTAAAPTAQNLGSLKATAPPSEGHAGYGLFAPDYTLIPGTTTEQEEAVKTAVGRLSNHLQSLLAAKLLRLSENGVSSELLVSFQLEVVGKKPQVLAQTATAQAQSRGGPGSLPSVATALASTEAGRFRFRLWNRSRQPLYCFLAAFDRQGRFSVYCPTLADPPLPDEPLDSLLSAAKIAPDSQRLFPESEAGWLFKHPPGTLEVFAVLSVAPFQQTWSTLRQLGSILQGDRLVALPTPLPVAQALLADLDAAAGSTPAGTEGEEPNAFHLKVSHWASLSLMS
jgi:hypothetical protein